MARKKKKKKDQQQTLSPSKLKSKLLKHFMKNPKKRLGAGQLRTSLRLDNTSKSIVHALKQLNKENLLRQISESKYVLNKSEAAKVEVKKSNLPLYKGIVDKIRSGAAYILVEALDKDVYVPYRHLLGAFNGDKVEVAVNFVKNKNPEGVVTRILERSITQIMGEFQEGKKYGVVKSASAKNHISVNIKKEDHKDAVSGDKVLVEVSDWGEGPNPEVWGFIKKVFKSIDDHNWTMENILVENGFTSGYPEEALREIQHLNDDYPETEIESRRDFRDVLTFTIDPDTAKDFDDALSYKELKDGRLEIGIHIADVTHYVKPDTALDKEAYNRSTSVYLVDRAIAMLPEKLSNNLCSLVPNADRLTFSAVFTFNNKNELSGEWFGKSIIHSDKRFTYEDAQLSIENPGGLYHKELTKINEIAKSLRREKFEQGAIAFESDELKFVLGDDNQPTEVIVKERKDAHLLIEDFMLLANKRVAHFITNKSKGKPIPFVYRIHDLPDIDRLADLSLFMKEVGIKMDLSKPERIAESFNTLSAKAKDDPVSKILMTFAIRTMAKAVYSTDNIGHYGLGFEEYTHFTSPIRRYADVLVHRIMFKNLSQDYYMDKSGLESRCIYISNQERKAMEAERDSIKYKQVEYINNHIGETFEGVVSGIFERGVFVQLSETRAEGLVPFEKFREYLTLAPGRFKATSPNGKESIKIGDPLTVRVTGVDLNSRQIDLDVVEQ